jgi:hypothetical protein
MDVDHEPETMVEVEEDALPQEFTPEKDPEKSGNEQGRGGTPETKGWGISKEVLEEEKKDIITELE